VLTRLWSFIIGYVSLVVEGKGLEKLINMSVNRGLYIWDVKWLDSGKAFVKVRLSGIKALRHIAKRTGTRFKIMGRAGLPFSVARMRKRKMLLAGAIMCFFLIYAMSSFIWFVEVKGNKEIPAEKIMTIAQDAGLAMGTLKFGFDKDGIEKYIRNEIPEVAWVGIKVTGTKALIEIAEKVIIPPIDNSPANLVAEKPGLIQEIMVLNGKPVVNEGDMVKQGDVLITGIIRPELKPIENGELAEETPAPPEPIQYVRARGIVRAKTWYDGYGEGRLIDVGTKRTGCEAQVLSLRMFGKELILKGPKTPPFQEYVTNADVKKLPEWRNIRLPVEIVTTSYYEVVKYRDIIGISEAKSQAVREAVANARSKVPADAKLVREMFEEIQTRGNIIRVKAIVEALEDIGKAESLDK